MDEWERRLRAILIVLGVLLTLGVVKIITMFDLFY